MAVRKRLERSLRFAREQIAPDKPLQHPSGGETFIENDHLLNCFSNRRSERTNAVEKTADPLPSKSLRLVVGWRRKPAPDYAACCVGGV